MYLHKIFKEKQHQREDRRDTLLDNFKLKQDSIFDLGELYKLLFRWFENNGTLFTKKHIMILTRLAENRSWLLGDRAGYGFLHKIRH